MEGKFDSSVHNSEKQEASVPKKKLSSVRIFTFLSLSHASRCGTLHLGSIEAENLGVLLTILGGLVLPGTPNEKMPVHKPVFRPKKKNKGHKRDIHLCTGSRNYLD